MPGTVLGSRNLGVNESLLLLSRISWGRGEDRFAAKSQMGRGKNAGSAWSQDEGFPKVGKLGQQVGRDQ